MNRFQPMPRLLRMSALAASCAAFLAAGTCGFEDDVHGRLASAICRGDANEVTRLLRTGVSPNATSGGDTKECGGAGAKPLDVAISCEQTQFVPILLAAGADPNCRTQPEAVPLHYAARRGDLLAARALVAAGANVNAVDRDGRSVLTSATENGNAELVTFLRAHGASMEGHPEIWQTIHELSYVTRFFKGTRCEAKENLGWSK